MKSRLLVFIFSLLLLTAGCRNGNEEGNRASVKEPTADLLQLALSYPDSVLLQEQLIQHYRELEKYDSAMRHATLMLKRDSLNPRWSYILGTLSCEKGDSSTAIEILERSLSSFPDVKSSILLGFLYAKQGNRRALTMAEKLRTLPLKAPAESYFISGTYLSITGEKELALLQFDSATRENYTFMEAYREKAKLLYGMKRYNEAIEVLDKAVIVKNNFEEGYFLKGSCLEKAGRNEEAAEAYRMALLYDPAYEEARQALEQLNKQNKLNK